MHYDDARRVTVQMSFPLGEDIDLNQRAKIYFAAIVLDGTPREDEKEPSFYFSLVSTTPRRVYPESYSGQVEYLTTYQVTAEFQKA
jgi:hypothetical protein